MDNLIGKYIVIEGIDGAGTTTQAHALTQHLLALSKANCVTSTREPTMLNPFGREIRRRLTGQLLPGETETNDADYWADLYFNDKKWLQNEVTLPSIRKGLHVVSDRHILSLAYQCVQGFDRESLIARYTNFYKPDLTLFLDVDSDVAFGRMGKSREGEEFFEAHSFLRKVTDEYRWLANRLEEDQSIVRIDGNKSIDEVFSDMLEAVYQLDPFVNQYQREIV